MAVVLLSVLSLEAGVLVARLFRPWEDASVDLRMRWRHALSSEAEKNIRKDVILLAIDEPTVRKLGKYGSGEWLWRKPFYDQLTFFEVFFEPSVVAYDFIFPSWHGSEGGSQKPVTRSPETLNSIIRDINHIASNPAGIVRRSTLSDLTQFSVEQGTVFFVHRLASIQEKGLFEVVNGYHFRGGGVDPQATEIPGFTDADVIGQSREGDENYGERVFYLKEMAIPQEDIHFPSRKAFLNYGYSPDAALPSRELLDYTLLGFMNGPRDPDSVIRRIPVVLGFSYYNSVKKKTRRVFVPSLALVSALAHMGVDFPLEPGEVEVFFGKEVLIHSPDGATYRIPVDERGRMYLNFRSKFEDIRSVSFEQVARDVHKGADRELAVQAVAWKEAIDDSLVFVGLTITGEDVGPYPLSVNKPVPMVHVHVTAVSNILNGDFIRPLKQREKVILWTLVFLCFTVICQKVQTASLGPVAALFLVLYILLSYAGVHLSWRILPLLGPGAYIAFCAFTVISYRFFVEEADRRKIRNMFSTMVSDKVLEYLEENPGSFSLKGHSAEATVFFSDVSGFTTMSEKLPPAAVTDILNKYLTPVTDCIMEHGGYVDKYIGDGVMAVWGAPYPDEQHALKACLAALEQQSIVRELNINLGAEYGGEFRVRMGLSSGPVTAGNMGSQKKFQYTVMGDVVNLASRLEPANKDFGTSVIISESTYQRAQDSMLARPLGRIRVAGKQQDTRIYELICPRREAGEETIWLVRMYSEALSVFERRQWDECIRKLEEILGKHADNPSVILKKRAETYRSDPPEDDWQGEYVRTAKE